MMFDKNRSNRQWNSRPGRDQPHFREATRLSAKVRVRPLLFSGRACLCHQGFAGLRRAI